MVRVSDVSHEATIRARWTMPEWMAPYQELFQPILNGGDFEEWMNDRTAYQINGPRALIACNIKGYIGALQRLHNAGLLAAAGSERTGEALVVSADDTRQAGGQ